MDLIDKRNAALRRLPDWAAVRAAEVSDGGSVAPGATFVSLNRTKRSHQGIGKHRTIETLFASGVDQDYLDEIAGLDALEYLWLGWPVTAADLSPLTRLTRLSYLKLDSPRNVTNFRPIAQLPALTHLFLENAKHLSALDWLLPLQTQLAALGVEGSITTLQKVPSIAPLAGFSFNALFMTSVQMADKDLTPLARCPNLTYLQIARCAPRRSFEALKALRSDIECLWFDSYDV
jgi:hypothetical protein